MQMIVLILLVLSIVSCGGGSSSGKTIPEQNQVEFNQTLTPGWSCGASSFGNTLGDTEFSVSLLSIGDPKESNEQTLIIKTLSHDSNETYEVVNATLSLANSGTDLDPNRITRITIHEIQISPDEISDTIFLVFEASMDRDPSDNPLSSEEIHYKMRIAKDGYNSCEYQGLLTLIPNQAQTSTP